MEELKPGTLVRCWGIIGGPYRGRVLSKGASKDCWIVRIKIDGIAKTVELHQDHVKRRP